MQELKQAVEYLNSINITACQEHSDGRVNSIKDEATIIKALQDKFGEDNIIAPKDREWFDVRIFGHPVQIKASAYSKGASDNFSSKAAILYALTTLEESEVAVRGWHDFEHALLKHSGDNNRDYYIISMNKDTGAFHLTSLKRLNKLTSNGNNLPFQIKWRDNIQPVERNHDDAYRFIVGAYKDSVRKKISVHQLVDVL